MYKLCKTFNAKAKQLKKERGGDLGGGVRREAVEEEEVFAPLKMAQTIQEQITQFKVRGTTNELQSL